MSLVSRIEAFAPRLPAITGYRLSRVQRELTRRDCAGALIFDPLNIAYATGTARSTVWNLHAGTRYAFVPAEGLPVLFENPATRHLYADTRTIAELRPAKSNIFWTAGPRLGESLAALAREIADLARGAAGGAPRLAVDRADPVLLQALLGEGVAATPAVEVMELARAVKSADELDGMHLAMGVCDAALRDTLDHVAPGRREVEVWSRLHETNIALGGERIETRLLSSGPRTNPWYQEAGFRVIEAGDVVAVDTDLVGPYGFLADISRTVLCGDGRPTGAQRTLYGLAHEQLQHNLDLVRPGVSFRDMSDKAWRLPDRFQANRYLAIAHGAGLRNDYPNIVYREDFARGGYDGVIEENMVLCIESYLGEENGTEGVKLEEQVIVTADGAEILSQVAYDDRLLA